MTLQIEFLWYPDCPSHDKARTLLAECLDEFESRYDGFSYQVEDHRIDTDELARAFNFPGSPTIRVNGKDIDPEGAESNPVALTCRVYQTPEGKLGPLPSKERIVRALEKALGE